jgi:hypothetical protein
LTTAAQNGNWRYWYDSIIDWMITNPGGTQRECAAALGKRECTISLIVNSDTFKTHYAARRRDYVERHDMSIITKTTRVAELALDGMIEKLDKGRNKLPLGQLADVSEKALARLGYGIQTAKPAPVQINVGAQAGAQIVQVPRETLAEARQNLRAIQTQKEAITVDFQEAEPQGSEKEQA